MLKLTLILLSLFLIASLSSGAEVTKSQLDSRSFELIAHLRDYDSGAIITFEEKYSAEQSRGLVKQTVRYVDKNKNNKNNHNGINWPESTQTYLVDTKENIAVVRDEDTNTCKLFDGNDFIVKRLRLDFGDFNVAGHEYIFGTARLLDYLSQIRSELKPSDNSLANYSVKNVANLKYIKWFSTPHHVDGDVLANVFYKKAAPPGVDIRDHGLPNVVQFTWPGNGRIRMEIQILSFKFTQGDSLADDGQLDLKLDALVLKPLSGCWQALASSDRGQASTVALEGLSDTDRFSFRAHVRVDNMPSQTGHRQFREFEVQVAHDSLINKMRVDLSPSPASSRLQIQVPSSQIYDFTLRSATHIMARSRSTSLNPINNKLDTPNHSQIDPIENTEPMPTLKEDHQQSDSNQYRCAYAAFDWATNHLPEITMDSMLLGTTQDFIYMGLARVRGIRARVFEAAQTGLPLWLEPPVRTDGSSVAASKSSSQADQNVDSDDKPEFVTLAYFSVPTKETGARLLLLEVYEVISKYDLLLSKHEVSVFDFGWNLQAIRGHHGQLGVPRGGPLSTSGDSALSLFSSVEYCSEWSSASDDQAYSGHASFDMFLESAEPVASSAYLWLVQNLPKMRLALLNTLQLKLQISLGLMYDLETRFIDHGDERVSSYSNSTSLSDADRKLKLVLRFNLGRPPGMESKYMYLGLRWNYETSWRLVHAFSMQQCFLLAAHSQREVEFAYDWKTGACYISKDLKMKGHSHKVESHNPLSVFQTLKVHDRHQDWWTKEAIWEDKQLTELQLDLGAKLEAADQQTIIKLHIKRLKIHKHEPRVAYVNEYGVGVDQSQGSSSVLLKFGWLEQAGLNRVAHLDHVQISRTVNGQEGVEEGMGPTRTELGPRLDSTHERMTLGQCQALCQADFDCKSYSYCIRGVKIQCILSKVNLSSPEFVTDVAALLRKQKVTTKGDTKLEFDLGDGKTIRLVSSRNCAIYTKQHLDRYSKDEQDLELQHIGWAGETLPRMQHGHERGWNFASIGCVCLGLGLGLCLAATLLVYRRPRDPRLDSMSSALVDMSKQSLEPS